MDNNYDYHKHYKVTGTEYFEMFNSATIFGKYYNIHCN